MLGFRGHFLTKSRAYSTTFAALRAATPHLAPARRPRPARRRHRQPRRRRRPGRPRHRHRRSTTGTSSTSATATTPNANSPWPSPNATAPNDAPPAAEHQEGGMKRITEGCTAVVRAADGGAALRRTPGGPVDLLPVAAGREGAAVHPPAQRRDPDPAGRSRRLARRARGRRVTAGRESRRRTTCGCGAQQAGVAQRDDATGSAGWWPARSGTTRFPTRALADSFRVRPDQRGTPRARRSSSRRGAPCRGSVRRSRSASWYDHACAYVDMKWPHAAGKSRQGIAESLATVTPALFVDARSRPSAAAVRQLLYGWSFNARARAAGPPEDRLAAGRALGGGQHPAGAGSGRPGGACGRRWTPWHCGWTAGRRRHRR